MGEVTEIGWTDATFNPWWGCTKIARGCTNCYAAAFSKRTGRAEWGDNGTRVKTSEANWRKPLKWNRDAEKSGVRNRVFCASMADVFEDWQGQIYDHQGKKLSVYSGNCGFISSYRETAEPPNCRPATLDDLRRDLFALIDQTPWLTWQLLTKRPENVLRMWPARGDYRYLPEAGALNEYPMHRRENVWLGCSISDQATADQNIPELLKCSDLCPVLFVSAEPLLAAVDITRWVFSSDGFVSSPDGPVHRDDGGAAISWIICGGESGPHYRPCQVEWIEDIARQCQAAGVPVYIKQDAGRFPGQQGRIPDDLWALKQFPGQLVQETA